MEDYILSTLCGYTASGPYSGVWHLTLCSETYSPNCWLRQSWLPQSDSETVDWERYYSQFVRHGLVLLHVSRSVEPDDTLSAYRFELDLSFQQMRPRNLMVISNRYI